MATNGLAATPVPLRQINIARIASPKNGGMLDSRSQQLFREQYTFCEQLSPREFACLVNEASARQLPPGTRVFDEDDPCVALPLVLEGVLRLFKRLPGEGELRLYSLTPGQSCIVTTAALLGQCPHGASAETDGEGTLLMLPRPLFEDLLGGNAAFRQFLFESFAARFAGLLQFLGTPPLTGIEQQLAALIMDHAPVLCASLEQIAAQLERPQRQTGQALEQFALRGWVHLGRDKVRILDPLPLQQLAAGRQV